MTTIQQFEFSVDLLRVLLWQYNDATKLRTLLEKKAAWYETAQKDFWDNWYRDVFDLTQCTEFGCVVWGIILGLPLGVALEGSGDRAVFGYGEYNENYDNGNFGRDGDSITLLTLEQKRQVLRLRYLQLTSDGTVPDVNFAFKTVFGGGHVLDGLDMTAVYVLDQAVPAEVQKVIYDYNLLPRPAGVMLRAQINNNKVFGFGDENSNFDNSQFGSN